MEIFIDRIVEGIPVVSIDGEETWVTPNGKETPEEAGARWVRDFKGVPLGKKKFANTEKDAVLVTELKAATTLADLTAALIKRFGP